MANNNNQKQKDDQDLTEDQSAMTVTSQNFIPQLELALEEEMKMPK